MKNNSILFFSLVKDVIVERSTTERIANYEEIGKLAMGETREDFEKFHNLPLDEQIKKTEGAVKKLCN